MYNGESDRKSCDTQGIPQQPGTAQIACQIAFLPTTLFSKMKMSK
jgi:hypothetical protein